MKKVAIPMKELVEILQLQMDTAGSATLTVTGGSMLPMLYSHRDSVVISPVTGCCNKTDVILYRRENGKYVLHRILRVRKEDYILCGDNQILTEKVNQEQVLAVVTGFTRNGKFFPVTHPGYRCYAKNWVFLHPVRWIYLIPRRLLGYIKAAIRRQRRKK